MKRVTANVRQLWSALSNGQIDHQEVEWVVCDCFWHSSSSQGMRATPYLASTSSRQGRQAVNTFFIISGFYMAMILTGTYKAGASNREFYANRLIRIFPVYWIGMIASLLAIAYVHGIGPYFRDLNALGLAYTIVSSLILFGQELPYTLCVPGMLDGSCLSATRFSLNPPAWSVSVELLFYLFAPFIVRSVHRSFAYLVVGALYFAALEYINFPIVNSVVVHEQIRVFDAKYFAIPASFMYFGTGAIAYHMMAAGPERRRALYPACLACVAVIWMTSPILPFWVVIAAALAVPALFGLTKNIPWDRYIGDLSYPVYILHYPILRIVRYELPPSMALPVTVVSTLALSILVKVLVEDRIEVVRSRVRRRAAEAEPAVREDRAGPIQKGSLILASSAYVGSAAVMIALMIIPYLTIVSGPNNRISPLSITDRNWNAGIRNGGVNMFLTYADDPDVPLLTLENSLEFATGVRPIIEVEITGQYAWITVGGEPLDPAQDGAPNELRIR